MRSYGRFKDEERVFATLYGGIVGDLMGVPVEFKKRGTFHVQDVIGYGTYNQPPALGLMILL